MGEERERTIWGWWREDSDWDGKDDLWGVRNEESEKEDESGGNLGKKWKEKKDGSGTSQQLLELGFALNLHYFGSLLFIIWETFDHLQN